jgi:hypothetical protein
MIPSVWSHRVRYKPARGCHVCRHSAPSSLQKYATTHKDHPLCNNGSKGNPPTRALVASCATSSSDSVMTSRQVEGAEISCGRGRDSWTAGPLVSTLLVRARVPPPQRVVARARAESCRHCAATRWRPCEFRKDGGLLQTTGRRRVSGQEPTSIDNGEKTIRCRSSRKSEGPRLWW